MLHRHWLVCIAVLAFSLTPGPAVGQVVEGGVRVYQDVLKSSVWVISDRGSGQVATGSGSLIDRQRRLVLTNYHVVGDIDRVTVMFPVFRDGKAVAERSYYKQRERELGIRGRVVARDKQADMSLILIDRVPDDARALLLATEGVSPGQSVHSVGNPGGSGALWVYTPGKVRAVYQKKWVAKAGREEFHFEARIVETDSPTNPGDSGGPLVNDQARLVGVTQGGASQASSLSTFIDVSEVRRFMNTQSVRAIPLPAGQTVREPKPVKDRADFFKPEAVKQANDEIGVIAHRYGRDVLVETYPTVPEGQADKAKAKANREDFFRDWTRQRARAEGVNGVVILICKEPTFLYVDVTESARTAVDDATATKVRETLLAKFRERNYDEGLLAALRMVRDKLAGQGP